MSGLRTLIKRGLGPVPLVAEAYQRWWASVAAAHGGYRLDRLVRHLPSWVGATGQARLGAESSSSPPSKRVLVFGYLQWWLEHAVALSLLLRSEGHQVDLAFLPHRRWQVDPLAFDLRRQRSYLERALAPLKREIGVIALRDGGKRLPSTLNDSLGEQSRLDVQYTLGREQIDWGADLEADELLRLRHSRNLNVGRAACGLLRRSTYHSVVIPNGSILEFGALYRVARHLGQQPVTYEFGERRQHMWLAPGAEVMRQPTEELWQATAGKPLTAEQRTRLEHLFQARKTGRSWDHFSRRWQRAVGAGAQAAAAELGIDLDRPVVLLCTNVVGDSLALDRQVFTHGMSDWLVETVRMLSEGDGIQLVVRVHPGEMLGAGHPSVQLVRNALPKLPDWVTVIPPESSINTYDLIELAQLGLVYTTTVGLEMAMHGVPVIVAGDTHYRGKGFTRDPRSMAEYNQELKRLLADLPDQRLTAKQVDTAWRYAYRFFFDYPFPFPWHLLQFWEDLEQRPLETVVQPEGRRPYTRTLRALVGGEVDWGVGLHRQHGVSERATKAEPEQVA